MTAYMKHKHNVRLVFDPTFPVVNLNTFETKKEWKEFYHGAEDAIPPSAIISCGKEVDLHMFVDDDHAVDRSNRQYHTGFIIFIQNSLIFWLSKKQATIESFVFGANFFAMKHGMETHLGLR